MKRFYDLNAWRLFLRIAETGSVSEVAAQETMEISTVSRTIEALEKSIGQNLFIPKSRPKKLTHAGQIAAQKVRELIASHEDFIKALQEETSELKGPITVSVFLEEPVVGCSGMAFYFPEVHYYAPLPYNGILGNGETCEVLSDKFGNYESGEPLCAVCDRCIICSGAVHGNGADYLGRPETGLFARVFSIEREPDLGSRRSIVRGRDLNLGNAGSLDCELYGA